MLSFEVQSWLYFVYCMSMLAWFLLALSHCICVPTSLFVLFLNCFVICFRTFLATHYWKTIQQRLYLCCFYSAFLQWSVLFFFPSSYFLQKKSPLFSSPLISPVHFSVFWFLFASVGWTYQCTVTQFWVTHITGYRRQSWQWRGKQLQQDLWCI